MKKLVVIIVAIILATFFYVTRSNSPTDTNQTPETDGVSTFHPDPSNATFILDNESITLSGGKNSRSVVPGSALIEETTLMNKFAYGDINADSKEDVALFLTRSGGGSGTFIYLGAYISGPVTYKGSNTVFVGDRIAPQSISISKEVVTIKYLDRKDGEAFATEPTVLVSKQFIFKDGELREK